MALTYSTEIPLGTKAPYFKLKGTTDGHNEVMMSLDDFKGAKALLVAFICKHCPYVVAIQGRLAELARDLRDKDLAVVAICSNDAERYPEDSFDNLKRQHREQGFTFPYLVDATQSVAKAYGAVCTPDFFLFDGDFALRYHGRLDDSWKDPTQIKEHSLRKAAEALLTGGTPGQDQTPSMGCSIKWIEG